MLEHEPSTMTLQNYCISYSTRAQVSWLKGGRWWLACAQAWGQIAYGAVCLQLQLHCDSARARRRRGVSFSGRKKHYASLPLPRAGLLACILIRPPFFLFFFRYRKLQYWSAHLDCDCTALCVRLRVRPH